jgi:hypothetical protein
MVMHSDASLRAQVVAEWNRVKHNMAQAAFCAAMAERLGHPLAPRTLRCWIKHVSPAVGGAAAERARAAVASAVQEARALAARLDVVLAEFDAQVGAHADAVTDRAGQPRPTAVHHHDHQHHDRRAAMGAAPEFVLNPNTPRLPGDDAYGGAALAPGGSYVEEEADGPFAWGK